MALIGAGILLGVLVGAGTALLLAPGTGAETRAMLARAGRGLGRSIGRRSHDAWDDLRDELAWAAHRGKRTVGNAWRARQHRRELAREDVD